MPRRQRKGRRKKKVRLERRYGYFRCKECNRRWESSYVFCIKDTLTVVFRQECQKCKIMTFPYRTEEIICSRCDCQPCQCSEEEKRQHVDPNKPHRSDLCEKCRRGWRCVPADDFVGFHDGYDDYD